jgi:hypothetical protein
MKRTTAETSFDAHIVHNCVRSSCDTLLTDAEAMVVEIYEYFRYLYSMYY